MNDQIGICQSMVNFYSIDCFTNKWRDLTSYSIPELIDFCEKNRIIDRVIGISAINAYSQCIFEDISFNFDFEKDAIDELNLTESDIVGMVGEFKPLIPKIVSKVKKLIVVEKDPTKIGNYNGIEIVNDPAVLENVDVAIITGTTIINDTIDDIIKLTDSARIRLVIGPTMGMLPDPFFKAGVDIIGGMKFLDSKKVMQIIAEGKGTMDFKNYANKYIIMRENYQKLI